MNRLPTSTYTPPELVSGTTLRIEGDEYTHLTRVLRTKTGDRLRVVDGCGTVYTADITNLERGRIRCSIVRRETAGTEPTVRLTLAVGLVKNAARFDVLIEKTTELGVAAIVPLLTERTVGMHARVDRWRRIAVSAMIQSGRAVLPEIVQATPFDSFVGSVSAGALRLIAHETTAEPHLARVEVGTKAVVCVGPEGGFSEEEVACALQAGFQPVSLGARRLRTETAGIAAATLVLSPT